MDFLVGGAIETRRKRTGELYSCSRSRVERSAQLTSSVVSLSTLKTDLPAGRHPQTLVLAGALLVFASSRLPLIPSRNCCFPCPCLMPYHYVSSSSSPLLTFSLLLFNDDLPKALSLTHSSRLPCCVVRSLRISCLVPPF